MLSIRSLHAVVVTEERSTMIADFRTAVGQSASNYVVKYLSKRSHSLQVDRIDVFLSFILKLFFGWKTFFNIEPFSSIMCRVGNDFTNEPFNFPVSKGKRLLRYFNYCSHLGYYRCYYRHNISGKYPLAINRCLLFSW